MRIALAQLNLLIGDLDAAMASIRAAANQAVFAGADLLVVPELATMGGYPPRDLLARRWLVERQWRLVNQLVRDLPLPAIIGCVEPTDAGIGPGLANAVIAVDQGRVVASYHKRLLPTYDVFDERRYFHPGEKPMVATIRGMRIGLTVCEDIWNAEFAGIAYHHDPVGELAGKCDLIVNASASPYHAGKPDLRRRLVATVAHRAKVPLVYCNQVGGQDELLFDGESGIIGPDGIWYAHAPRWREAVVVGDLAKPIAVPALVDDCADLWQALVVGIRDYCAKTRQTSVVLGLSGGIDSALVATLAVDALGPERVIGISMPGPYSSQGSIDDALALAGNLGIECLTLPITDAFRASMGTLGDVFHGAPKGLAEENLQARLRGVTVMAVANHRGAMALTTGNKSEVAVGYCTLYGDTNGGLGPIGDVYKTQVWELARHANRERVRIPEASITKAPSAELKPDQTDQDTLPPYADLDRILEAYLEDGDSPEAIIARGEDETMVRKVVRMVEVSEFKRRQGPPILRVSGKAFGVGRRMPIARAI